MKRERRIEQGLKRDDGVPFLIAVSWCCIHERNKRSTWGQRQFLSVHEGRTRRQRSDQEPFAGKEEEEEEEEEDGNGRRWRRGGKEMWSVDE